MNYEQIETDIIERLETLMPTGVVVVALPESEDELEKPFLNSRITVCYKGSQFRDLNSETASLRSTGRVVQGETVEVEVVIQSRFLRTGNDSAHKLLVLVRRALLGYKPTNCDRLYARRHMLVPNDQEPADLFTFVTSFECGALAVEEYDSTAEDGANITQITFDDERHGNVVVS